MLCSLFGRQHTLVCYDDGLDGICNVFALFNNQNCKKKRKKKEVNYALISGFKLFLWLCALDVFGYISDIFVHYSSLVSVRGFGGVESVWETEAVVLCGGTDLSLFSPTHWRACSQGPGAPLFRSHSCSHHTKAGFTLTLNVQYWFGKMP